MIPQKPYLVRAVYEWILDNQLTPYFIVDTQFPGCRVPEEHIQDDQIVLNVSPTAVKAFNIDNDVVVFNARFSGVPRQILVPVEAINGVLSKENGQGMQFNVDYELAKTDDDTEEDVNYSNTDHNKKDAQKNKKSTSHLKVVK